MRLSDYVKANKPTGYIPNRLGRSDHDRVIAVLMHVELKMTLWEVATEYEVTDEAVRQWVRKAERGDLDHIQITDDERDDLIRRHGIGSTENSVS